MQCTTFRQQLDAYVDGHLQDVSAMDAHADACAACASQLALERRFRDGLRALAHEDMPDAAARAERLLAPVRKQGLAVRYRAFTMGGFAAAASLALGMVIGMQLMTPERAAPGVDQMQIVALQPDREQSVRLVFRSPADLEGARIHLAASDNVEFAGYPGQRELSWEANLTAGANLLELPVTLRGGEGSLVATITYGDGARTFNVTLRPQPDAGASLQPHSLSISQNLELTGDRYA